MPRSVSLHGSFFDVYCPCYLTLLHTRQRVHEHLVHGKCRCLQFLAASVEPAFDVLVQQLLDQDKRVRRASKHVSLEGQPKHLPGASGRDRVELTKDAVNDQAIMKFGPDAGEGPWRLFGMSERIVATLCWITTQSSV